ncbi:hypothetical protein M5K25_008563 [Dendrobium thyrsiflorum]|uniref:Tail specific protease domain-containing protein n=1 Tax=Dendrobium thyrsiflorum TaxID=117978 RepID=A0ABD0VFN6_DENTH
MAIEEITCARALKSDWFSLWVKVGEANWVKEYRTVRRIVDWEGGFAGAEILHQKQSFGILRIWEGYYVSIHIMLSSLTALKNLLDYGVSYLVLDLRDNLGGLVQAGIEVAKLFLGKGETLPLLQWRTFFIMKIVKHRLLSKMDDD